MTMFVFKDSLLQQAKRVVSVGGFALLAVFIVYMGTALNLAEGWDGEMILSDLLFPAALLLAFGAVGVRFFSEEHREIAPGLFGSALLLMCARWAIKGTWSFNVAPDSLGYMFLAVGIICLIYTGNKSET